MKIEKFVIVAGFATLAAFSAAGCGSKDDATTTAAPPTAPNAQPAAPAAQKNMPSRPAVGKMTAPQPAPQ